MQALWHSPKDVGHLCEYPGGYCLTCGKTHDVHGGLVLVHDTDSDRMIEVTPGETFAGLVRYARSRGRAVLGRSVARCWHCGGL
jgi:hypothetical protein